jgi:CRP-like cAMP-binding protein
MYFAVCSVRFPGGLQTGGLPVAKQKSHGPTANAILKALPREEYEQLLPYLEPVKLSREEILYHSDEPIKYVYFPNRGTVSVLAVFENGQTVGIAMVGNEGMFSVSAFLGSITAPVEAIVQIPGDAFRLRTEMLRREFRKCGHFHDMLLRYTQAYIIQISQNSACHRAHHIENRLARCLLMCQDRSLSADLPLTHELIGMMLGARRSGVTQAAQQLRDKGVIRYARGRIVITSREGVEAASCSCYPILKSKFDQLIGNNMSEKGGVCARRD